MRIFNLFAEQEWDNEQDREGYRHRVVAIVDALGGALLGGSLSEVPSSCSRRSRRLRSSTTRDSGKVGLCSAGEGASRGSGASRTSTTEKARAEAV